MNLETEPYRTRVVKSIDALIAELNRQRDQLGEHKGPAVYARVNMDLVLGRLIELNNANESHAMAIAGTLARLRTTS